jgi:hypothetical protein
MNEADVVTRIIKFLEDVLKYDVLKDITKEFIVKERYVDLAVKINDKVKFYIEVKSSNTKLRESHIYQAESYASQGGVSWVILTNGAEWQLYHLIFDKSGIEHSLIFSIDLMDDNLKQNAEKIYYLSKSAMRNDEIEEYWHKQVSLSGGSIIKALFHEDTLASIRREIRRTSDILIDEDEIVESLKKLLNPEIVSQYEDNIKIRRRRKIKTKKGISDADKSDEKQQSSPNINSPSTDEISKDKHCNNNKTPEW